jgi:hypothetical protein
MRIVFIEDIMKALRGVLEKITIQESDEKKLDGFRDFAKVINTYNFNAKGGNIYESK